MMPHQAQHPAITTPILRLDVDPVKALRFASTPFGAHGLDRLSIEPREGTYVMAGCHEARTLTNTQHHGTRNSSTFVAAVARTWTADLLITNLVPPLS
jgi:hypothetical protein